MLRQALGLRLYVVPEVCHECHEPRAPAIETEAAPATPAPPFQSNGVGNAGAAKGSAAFRGFDTFAAVQRFCPVPVLVGVFGVRFSVAALRPVSAGGNGVWMGVQGCWPCTIFREQERVNGVQHCSLCASFGVWDQLFGLGAWIWVQHKGVDGCGCTRVAQCLRGGLQMRLV